MGFNTQSAVSGATAGASFGPWGAAIGGIAGGLLGGGGTSKASWREPMDKQYEQQRHWAKIGPYLQTQGAKAAGLHPSVVMGGGASAFSPAGVSVGGQEGSIDFSGLGQAVDRARNVGKSSTQQQLEKLQLEKAGLENDYLKTQIAGSKAAITRTAAVPPVHTSRVGKHAESGLNDYLKSVKINKIGIDDGFSPRHKIMVGQDGRAVRVLNTEAVGDNEILMAVDALTSTIPDLGRNYIRRHAKTIKSNSKWLGKKAKQKLKKFKKRFTR